MEYLLVQFPEKREVVVDGNVTGFTNTTLRLTAGHHVVSLAPPADFTPAQIAVALKGTSTSDPSVVHFQRIEAKPQQNEASNFEVPNQPTGKASPDIAQSPDPALYGTVLPIFDAIEIIDQGKEPVAVGCALAAVVNYVNRRSRSIAEPVSFQMIYDLARQRDEFKDEHEGTSLRAGLEVLRTEGVCPASMWRGELTPEVVAAARKNRIDSYTPLPRGNDVIGGLRKAVQERGIVPVAAGIHEGWRIPTWQEAGVIPMLQGAIGGHSFAVVGYTSRGFLIQNSWGKKWGGVEFDGRHHPGLAIWTYEDAETNLTEAWRVEIAQKSSKPWSIPYDADKSSGKREEDFLDIGADVDALASLIAARTMSPPLSVGLFGDWGSGKTFFIRALKNTVETLSTSARVSGKLQKEVAYYKHIVQIEFNAWHYVQADLWAGLLDRIFGASRSKRESRNPSSNNGASIGSRKSKSGKRLRTRPTPRSKRRKPI